ncbi:glycosyltransferase [Saccharopolyspora shandongensis]|uniref:glycosyltransferase n=1 Tax=Saccharopolyspora shandongensis TaxID=418495 RepID=UPI00343565B5
MVRRTALMVHPGGELYGSDRIFLESVIALTEAGWRVVVALPARGPLADRLRDQGADVVLCPTPVLRKAALRPAGFLRLLLEGMRAVAPTLRLLRRTRPDVVYVNTVTVPLWLLLARSTRRPVIAHVHEAEDSAPRLIRTALAAPLLCAVSVVVNSEATARVITRSLPWLRRRIRLVYNGVAGPVHAAARGGERPDPVRIVLVGRLSPRKGTDVAVRSIARLRADGHDVVLELLGSAFSGYEWYERQLEDLVRRHGLAGVVAIRGFRADVWDAYRDADIALVPSRFEPFGNTAVEAQLAGTPVIVTDVQGLPETVAQGRYGRVVPADDPDALAEAVSDALAEWQGTLDTAAQAREHAQEVFSPQRYRADIAAIATDVARCR